MIKLKKFFVQIFRKYWYLNICFFGEEEVAVLNV